MLTAIGRVSIFGMLLFAFSSHSILAQIAPGVQQSAAQTATVTGTVTQSDGMAVSGAEVSLTGTGARFTTKTDVHGTFAFTSVPYGNYRVVVTSSALGGTSQENIAVKGDITVAVRYSMQAPNNLKTIAHVSTASAGASINVTAASVASITPSDYAFQGNSSWKELLNQIPGVTVGGDLNLAYQGSGQAFVMPGSPFQPVILSINGALPYETSVTLDGMPLVNDSFATGLFGAGSGSDIGILPMSMFDTADVVRGPGADAPSIVDSIGGSFVLHAPSRVEKNSFEFSASNDAYGGTFTNTKAQLRFGRLSAVISYGFNNSPGPFEGGVPLYCNAGITAINGSPVQPYSSFLFGFANNNDGYNQNSPTFGEGVSSLFYGGIVTHSDWGSHSGAIALSYDVTPSVTAQVFYSGASSWSNGQPAPNGLFNFVPGPGYTGNLLAGTFIGSGSSGFPIYQKQASDLLEEKFTVYLGRGVLRLAAVQNNGYNVQSSPNLLFPPSGEYPLYGTACVGTATGMPGCPSGGTYTVYNGTPASLSFPFQLIYANEGRINNRDLLASYAVQIGSKTSVGASYVTSYYNDPWVLAESIPTFAFTTVLSNPAAASETTNEMRLYASSQLSDKLSLNGSWYFARGSFNVPDPNDPTRNTWVRSSVSYSAPRLSAVWRPNSNAAVRFAAGGGFALPQLFNMISNNTLRCGTGNSSADCFQTLDNLNLAPEKSFGFDLGTDIRLHHDTVLSFDLYRTTLYGQIFQGSSTASYSGPLCSSPPCTLFTTQFNNLGVSRYEGIIIDARHDVPKGIYWHGALGLTRAYVVSVPAGFYNVAGQTCAAATYATTCQDLFIIPGINFNGFYPSTVPYANGSAQIGYRWSAEKFVELEPTYYGNNNPYFEPAFFAFNARAGYPLTKNVELAATFRNITGIYGQDIQTLTPFDVSLTAPSAFGTPSYAEYGLPYGLRSVTITANFRY